jgi:hypothetical protein
MKNNFRLSGNGLKDFFLDLRSMRFTGEVLFECGDCNKAVFVQSGEITHCTSTLLDDRLGDVIYREGKLSLDVFVDFAGKVSEKIRFGDLLIKNEIFSLVELWDALNSQSKVILQSLVFYELLEVELRDSQTLKTPDFGLRFRWDEALTEALEELRTVRRFERAARNSPALTIDERHRNLVSNDFQRDIVSLIEEHGDFNVIVDDKSPLSKVYTVRAIFQMYVAGLLIDSWDIFSQDLLRSTENELQEVVGTSSRVFLLMEDLVEKYALVGWDAAVRRAAQILEREFGPGVYPMPQQGFALQHLHKAIVMNKEFKIRALMAAENRWPLSIVALVQEGLHKALLYLLFEISNNRGMEEETKKIHSELVNARGSYFSRVAEAIS